MPKNWTLETLNWEDPPREVKPRGGGGGHIVSGAFYVFFGFFMLALSFKRAREHTLSFPERNMATLRKLTVAVAIAGLLGIYIHGVWVQNLCIDVVLALITFSLVQFIVQYQHWKPDWGFFFTIWAIWKSSFRFLWQALSEFTNHTSLFQSTHFGNWAVCHSFWRTWFFGIMLNFNQVPWEMRMRYSRK